MTLPAPHAGPHLAIPDLDPQDAIGLCLAGHVSPQVALCRLLLGGADADAIAAQVEARRPPAPNPRWDALAGLLHGRGAMLARLAAEVGRHGGNHAAIAAPLHPPGAAPPAAAQSAAAQSAPSAAAVAAFFDNAVAFSPEASVALYSLGDPAILAQATAEIMDWLHRHGCVGPTPDTALDVFPSDSPASDGPPPDVAASAPSAAPPARGADVLDLGCGIGRLAVALAPRCRSVLGLDVSAGMVAEARRRCAAYPAIRIEATSGTDLDALPAHAFDLILAVDSMPYLVQVGPDALATHIRDAARVLRPNGRLAILNLSFGRPLEQDTAELSALADRHGFTVQVAGERPFALWDAAAFLLRRDAAELPPGLSPPAAVPPGAVPPAAVPPAAPGSPP